MMHPKLVDETRYKWAAMDPMALEGPNCPWRTSRIPGVHALYG